MNLQKIIEEHKKWLTNKSTGERAYLRHYDLSYYDFSYAFLEQANFSGSSFSGSNLSHADFIHANFIHANLSYCNFSHANLSYCNFSHANLSYCNFSHANLRHCNFTGADLRGAKGIIYIANEYPYANYGYYYNNQKRIRFGCFDRTVEEWEKDFWNNNKKFPEDSPQGKIRYNNFLMIKMWFEMQDKLKEGNLK